MTLQALMELGTLSECAYECTRQSRWKETTQRYLANLLANNMELRREVLSGSYRVRPTVDFTLNERGHIRHIEAPVVRDRIVQKTLMKHVLIPALRPCLIYDNYASLTDRGTAFARKRFEVMMRRYMAANGTDGYVLTVDVRKYFESISHDILKRLMAPRIADQPEDVRDLIHYTIDSGSKTGRGLNLGSECPQIYAVFYLNPLDVFMKTVRGVKYYGRYMDDIFVIGRSKKELSSLLTEIEEKLAELGLETNPRKTNIVRITHGFTFLQVKYSVTPTGRIVKRLSHGKVCRERRRLMAFRRQMDDGQMTENEILNCYRSWRGTIVKDHNACRKSLASMDALYRRLFPEHREEPAKGRKALAEAAFAEAGTDDMRYCLTFNQ